MNTTPRFIAALALASAFVSTAANAADSSAYFRVDAGPVVVRDISADPVTKLKTKTGVGFCAVGGFKLTENVALELESGYQYSELDKLKVGSSNFTISGHTSVVPILVNGVLSGKLSESISANVGAGIGAAVTTLNAKVSVLSTSENYACLMAQFKTGLEFKVSERVSTNLSYRLGLVDGDPMDSGTVVTHMVTAGVGFKF